MLNVKRPRTPVARLAAMGSLRRCARWLCAGVAVVLLFAQLATAAYACPAGADATQRSAPMAGCDGHAGQTPDPAQPQLCKAHCQQGSQVVGANATPDLLSTPLLWAVLDWAQAALQPLLPAQQRLQGPASGAPPPGAPPIYLSLLVLRN